MELVVLMKEVNVLYTQTCTPVTCPTCQKEFYPHEAYCSKYLCGEELCPPSPKLERILGCRMQYFCSEECYRAFEATPRSCSNINYVNHWMGRIIKAASSK